MLHSRHALDTFPTRPAMHFRLACGRLDDNSIVQQKRSNLIVLHSVHTYAAIFIDSTTSLLVRHRHILFLAVLSSPECSRWENFAWNSTP